MVGLVAMTALLTPAYARPAAPPAPAPLPPGRPNASPPPPAEPNAADLRVPSAPAAAPGPPPAEAAVSHVGIHAGAGKIRNAPQTGDVVRYSRVSSQAFSGARRL